MKFFLFPALLAALALGVGCDRVLLPEKSEVYAPWEEGLTLGFENPSLDGSQRAQDRYQVRVKSCRPTAQGRVVVQTSTTLTGQVDLTLYQNDGGVSLGPDPDGQMRLLPRGFPERTSRWEDRGRFHWVVGRALVTLPGVQLADPHGVQGIWVESAPVQGEGPRKRTLYLPDIGEAETLLWKDGVWVPIFRLVSRSFTDLKVSE